MAEQKPETVASDTTSQETVEVQPTETAASDAANQTAPEKTTEQTANTAPVTVVESQEMKLRRRSQEAEKEAAYWRGRAESGAKPPEALPPVKEGLPKLEDYEDYDKFQRDSIKYELRQEQIQEDAKRQTAQLRDTYTERFNKAKDKIPNLPEIARSFAEDTRLPKNYAMAEAIIGSDIGPEIVFHLGTNFDEAIRIAKLSPTLAAKEIGKIEAKLMSTPPSATVQRISQAPNPIEPVGSQGSVIEVKAENMSTDDWMAKRNAEATTKITTRRGTRVVLK